ncbi:MAG: ATP-binding cassette domain-containing protein [Tissierellia bacterium]|nr:ATP-binding cassette domain-containing protein [Tissierellia bacterium]
METKYLLEMININKSFPGVKALDNARLKVKPGTVHALMGENGAGKSTLMKVLFGIYKEDSGEIYIDGEKLVFKSPKDALEHGVAMVHQELNQVLQRDVADNMMLGRFPTKSFWVDQKKMYEYCEEVFKDLNIDINPRTITGQLSVAQRQLIEIAKAVSYDAKILVLDEPSSSLTEQEVEILFRIIDTLKKRGVGIIYISHKMEEILRISDEVTVMRDGKWIATEDAKDLTTDKIISLMVGRSVENVYPPKTNIPRETLLKVENFSGQYPPTFTNANFELRKGEILGIAGLVGARRTELVETIFGLRAKKEGKLILNGKEIKNRTPMDAINNGFALVTEERRSTGIFPMESITFNTAIASIKDYLKFIFVNNKKMSKAADLEIKALNIKTPSNKTQIRNLSGGNQQKVIMSKWLLTNPSVLLLDEPTRGIDVGAKYEIYQLIINLANEGKGIIVISSEMPELFGICDRIMVMSDGHVSGIENVKDLDQHKVMELATKYL